MIDVFIGYDPREAIAFSVLAYSIQTRALQPVSIAPLMLTQLKTVLTRERHPLQSTDFSFSRFLTPCTFRRTAVNKAAKGTSQSIGFRPSKSGHRDDARFFCLEHGNTVCRSNKRLITRQS